jgi:hypothetical protein
VRNLQLTNVDPEALDFVELRMTGSNNLTSLLGFRPKVRPVQWSGVNLPLGPIDLGGPPLACQLQEEYGWHVPIMTGQETVVRFANRVDFQTMDLRYSEPYYIQVRQGFCHFSYVWPHKRD